MKYFHFTGETYNGSNRSGRMQVYITDLETGREYKPILTSRNKSWNKFCKYSKKRYIDNQKDIGFYFTGNINFSSSVAGSLRQIVIYDKDEFLLKFAEFII